MSLLSVKYSVLSEALIKIGKDKSVFYDFVKKQFHLSDSSFELYRKFTDNFIKNHMFRWQKKSKFRPAYFKKHFASWLDNSFELPRVTFKDSVRKDYADCSERTKKRRGEQLCQEKSSEEIQLAFISNLKQTDEIGAQIVKSLASTSTATKQQALELLRGNMRFEIPYTPNEALAYYIDVKSTKHQYEVTRSLAESRNSHLYPPYHQLVEAKASCYPDGKYHISDSGVKIPLQSLLDHTAQRIIDTIDKSFFENACNDFEMFSKYGMDGTSGQSSYKQIFKNDLEHSFDDSSVYMISMVPLQIKYSGNILWTNSQPSSTRLCRPISFEFIREKAETTIKKYEDIEQQIKNLKPTIFTKDKIRVRLYHKVFSTMLDGKSIGYLTNTADCNCCICGAKPSQMSNIQIIRSKHCAKENYRFGLSSLHCWIRFLECVLHIAYKLPIRKWKAKTDEEKTKVALKKDDIQKIFKEEKGWLLDFVKQGVGNSNDGNTARLFFFISKYSAEKTGVSEELIERFRVILIAVTSREKIDKAKFEKYATDTINVYNMLYGDWYFMPSTVHKILFHGAEVMEFFDLPIGYFSEEAQEARNKDFKRIRECNTRKMSRVATNEDIIHALLVSSDPVINNLREIAEPKKTMMYPPEVMDLFKIKYD